MRLPIPEESLLRRQAVRRQVEDGHGEDAPRGRDERDFSEAGVEGGEEFLGELWKNWVSDIHTEEYY